MNRPILAAALVCLIFAGRGSAGDRPNFILLMADDMGYGDPAFMGNPHLRTPHLDAMAKHSLRFNRFYAAAPVCSPTRGSCLTGRHPYRYGVTFANVGHLPKQEITIAGLLKQLGYVTGHFGKWHLGTLTTTEKDGNRGGPKGKQHYSPPWEHAFDVCFSTESKVPTFNPMKKPFTDAPYGTCYWKGPDLKETENLEGDDSRVIMDRAIPFIQEAARGQKPFLAVIWFHTPHLPVVAGPDHLKMYPQLTGEKQHYFGCTTALDEQVGRLRAELRNLGIAENTVVWFCSDNGPEGNQNAPGSAGPLRGRKRSLLEGGIRVPALLEWPARIKTGSVTDVPVCTSDYLPTILQIVKLKMPDSRPLDGISMLPLLDDPAAPRPRAIGFESGAQLAWSDNRYVLCTVNKGKSWELYDIVADPGQKRNLAEQQPQQVQQMRAALTAWRQSCRDSLAGKDYPR